MGKLFILTLNWEGKEKLQRLYPTLIESLKNINYEWLIKDNGSKDGSSGLKNQWNNEKVRMIEYGHNRDNFAMGCNFLFKEASPQDDDLILLLNNDVIFGDGCSLKKMIDLFQDPNVGVVGSRLLYTNTNKLQHAGVVFSAKHHGLPYHYRANEVADKTSSLNREFQAVTGAVWLTKAKYFRGAFDENFHWAFEDISACLTIKNVLNKKIIYCGETLIYHDESASLKKNPVNKLFMNHNANHFIKKWKGKYEDDSIKYSSNIKYNLYKVG